METLFAYSYLWSFGFSSMKEYNDQLGIEFLACSDCEILLELEECSSDYKDTFLRLKRYFDYESESFDGEKFGTALFSGLKRAYIIEKYDFEIFCKKCYRLWLILPAEIAMEEPFFTLSYADDCLSYGDDEQSRRLYEKAFEFYC